MKKIFASFIISFVFVMPVLADTDERGNDSGDLFYKTNQFYKKGIYHKAVDGYLRLLQSDTGNGHLYYNLGNACFRLNQLGHAILYYERARLLMPRDADLDYNLRYARQQTRDIIDDDQDALSMTFFWLDSVTQDEVFWIFAIINGIFWTALILRLYRKEEWTYYLVVISLVVWIVSGVSFGWKWHITQSDDRAVILADEINVLSGPDANDTVLFKLHSGTIAHFEREEDAWALVSLNDKKRGWVEAQGVGLVKSKAIRPLN